MERIVQCFVVVNAAISAVILLRNGLAQIAVEILEQLSGVVGSLEEDEDEDEFVDDGDGEGQPPDGRMRPHERPVGHDGHAEGDPEEETGQEGPLGVVV